MIPAAARRILSAGASALIANGFTFLVAIFFVRSFTAVEFGVYAMLTTLLTVANMVTGSLVAQQMAYSLPRSPDGPLRSSAARMYASVAAILTLLFLPVVIGILLHGGVKPALLLPGSFYIAASMYRAYARQHFFSVRMPRTALRQDTMFVILASAQLGALAICSGFRDALALILFLLAAANVASVAIVPPPRPALVLRLLRRHVMAYRRHIARASWSAAIVSLSSISLLSPNLVLMASASLTGLAVVTAPNALLAPLRLATVMFQSTLRAEFSHLVHERRHQEVRLLYAATTAGCVCLGAVLLGCVHMAWPMIYSVLFSRGYDSTAMLEATMLSVVVTSFSTTRLPGAMLLNAHNRFAVSAIAWAVIAPLVILMAIGLASTRPAATLYAPLCGEIAIMLVEFLAVIRFLYVSDR